MQCLYGWYGHIIKFGKVLASQGDKVVDVEKAVASGVSENVEMVETILPPPAVVVLDVEVERVGGGAFLPT